MIIFATAGRPNSYQKRGYPHELAEYLGEFGLNGFEVQCGKGVNISGIARSIFPKLVKKDINLSLHAPYYISLSSIDETTRDKSIGWIVESALAAEAIGAKRVVIHAGSCAKIPREKAFDLALESLKKARFALDEMDLEDIILCPETMGKCNQLGTLEEVVALCEFDKRMLPCVDFGHLNARTFGELKSRADYAAIFDTIEDKLGIDRLRKLHVHFSKIEYTQSKSGGGEKKHLTFDEGTERGFGPEYEPFLDEVHARGLQPFIVCESDGTQAEDCAKMAEYYYSR
ncbi:MAG: TIM barrel protein [Oscillospiraceae bacterium]|nr:TIM barrel protein [Oscillospiraceae bacterium]